mgnify:CR=1 FL=1
MPGSGASTIIARAVALEANLGERTDADLARQVIVAGPAGSDRDEAERVRAGLTQAQLGARLGVSARRIANVEGPNRPSQGIARRIISALTAVRDG